MSNTINIYQIFTRLFRNDNGANKLFGTIAENGVSKFNDIDEKALQAFKAFGITHLWYTGIIRHATCTDYSNVGIPQNNPNIVKGRAGSPYAIQDYYDVDPDLSVEVPNRMNEFEALVKRTHKQGMKVIIDFVPNHVAREYKSLCKDKKIKDLGCEDDNSKSFLPNNNFYHFPWQNFKQPDDINFPYTENTEPYQEQPAKATGNDAFTPHPSLYDWYETIKLNYGVDYLNGRMCYFNPIPNTWEKMKDILLYWAAKGVDAFRCDMAEMVPVEFWEWAIKQVKLRYPVVVFIAEVYNPSEYHNYLFKGGFDYLYDKVGLYDFVRDITCGYRPASILSSFWKTREGIHHNMVRFMENHDEQRIASPQFAGNAFAGIPGMVVSATMHASPLMLYFGQEIGEPAVDEEGYSGKDGRTTIFDYWKVTEYQKWVNKGAFDGALLSEKQKILRATYHKLLKIRNESDALQNGDFYDVMYANNDGIIDKDKIFAYLRHSQKQVLLLVVNFDTSNGYEFKIKLPQHAFDYLAMPVNYNYTATDYFDQVMTIAFDGERAINDGIDMEIRPKSALLFDITPKLAK